MKSVIVGTAGHIDHGKTSLVKALTGIDADRLEEEKRRGITIDLGFAHLEADGVRLGFVDVPGHEKFVRNMLAGVGGIDIVLLVIAADEGVMPQTREHFEICRLLGIQRGLTVLTKSDAVDAETLAVVRSEVADFLQGTFLDPQRAPMLAVSSLSGAGMNELREALLKLSREIPGKSDTALLRLPIDRVFTMHGFGTVATGTLISGVVVKEQEVEILPGRQRARVRGVQVHGESTDRARAGERTALNLSGINKEDLHRGQVIVPTDTFAPAHRFEVEIELSHDARPLKDKSRVHLHAFTAEAVAEVALLNLKELKPGTRAFAQLRLPRDAEPMMLLPGDRFILRQFSPVVTIGGGCVLDANPLNKRLSGEARAQFLTTLRDGTPTEQMHARLQRRGALGFHLADAVRETGWPEKRVEQVAGELVAAKQAVRLPSVWIDTAAWTHTTQLLLDELKHFHSKNPLLPGMGRAALRDKLDLKESVFAALLEAQVRANTVALSSDLVHLAGHKVVMRSDESAAQKTIEDAFRTAGLAVPAVKEVLMKLAIDRIRAQKIIALLVRDKVLIKVTEELIFHHSALEGLKAMLQREKAKSPQVDVARFKDLTGVSRKYAIPLLEWLDRERITRRVGDSRQIL